jgi:hypothetical protein
MKIFKELAAELVGMFVAETRLTLAVLVLIAVTGLLVNLAGVSPLVGGALLLFGCLVLLIESVYRSGRAGAS